MNLDREAAGQGNAEAQFDLGFAYLRGEGLPKDRDQAVEWFRRAAKQGHADAQHFLAEVELLAEQARKASSSRST